MIKIFGIELRTKLQKEKEQLEGALKKERLRSAALVKEHLWIHKVMSESHSEGMKRYSIACKEKDNKISKLTDGNQASGKKIADLKTVIAKLDREKIVCDNIQEELTKLLKSGKIVSSKKINEQQTRIDKLQAIVDASNEIAIEAEDKLNSVNQDRNDTIARLKTVQLKLDTKIQQAVKHDQESSEAADKLRLVDIEVLTLNKRIDVLVRDAGLMETLIKGQRLDNINMLKKSNKKHQENDAKRLSQLMELRKEAASKDEEIA